MHKRQKRLLIITSLIILTIFIFWQWTKNAYVKKWVGNKLKQEASSLWGDKAIIDFETINIYPLQKKIHLRTLTFTLYDAEKDTVAHLSFDKLGIKWPSYTSITDFNNINLEAIEVIGLQSILPHELSELNPTNKEESSQNPTSVRIGSIHIPDAKLIFYNEKTKAANTLKTLLNLKAEDFSYDSSDEFDIFQSAYFKELTFKQLHYALPDDIHHVSVAWLSFNPDEGCLQAANLEFKPRLGRKAFASHMKVQKDHIIFSTDSLTLKGLKLTTKAMLILEEMTLKNSKLTAYKDKNYPLPDDRFVPILVDKLEDSEFPIYIGTTTLEQMTIVYHELGKGKEKHGTLWFDQVNATISNITNIADSVHKNKLSLMIRSESRFYGKGKLTAYFTYGLQTRNGDFHIKGHLGKMDISKANDILEPLIPARVQSGRVDDLSFTFNGDRLKSNGEMEFRYSDLRLNINTEKGDSFKDNILSGIANLALSEFNPKPNGKLRIGQIDNQRDTRKSMFYFWWASLRSGFMSTLGVLPPKTTKEDNSNESESLWNRLFNNDDE